jgi:hypothetical protein
MKRCISKHTINSRSRLERRGGTELDLAFRTTTRDPVQEAEYRRVITIMKHSNRQGSFG